MTAARITDCRAARLPKASVYGLAPWRHLRNVRVVEEGETFWVTWDAEIPGLVEALLPLVGVRLFVHDRGEWLPFGGRLPAFDVPTGNETKTLDGIVLPSKIAPALPEPFAGRIEVTILPCDRPRAATAVRCNLEALADWCENATRTEIERLRGIIWSSSPGFEDSPRGLGGQVLSVAKPRGEGFRTPGIGAPTVWLKGLQPPLLPRSDRFWGATILIPLGHRPEPDWPESALRKALLLDDDEILVLTADGAEILPANLFQPLSRAGVRLAGGAHE